MRRLILTAATALLAVRAYAYYPQFNRTSLSSAYRGWKMRVGDFNSDGRPDMMVASGNASVRMSLLQSDGTLDAATVVYSPAYLSDFDVADFDGDGKPDVVAADTGTNALAFLHGNGDETFAAAITTPLAFAPTQIAAGDYTGDGKLDLAIRSYSAALILVYAGDGAGHFSEAFRAPLADTAFRMSTGDIDGDGKSDILIAHADVWRYDLYYGRGDGTFDAPVWLASPANYQYPVVLADLDGDGDAELISTQFDPAVVTIFVNLGGRAFAAAASYPLTSGNPVDLTIADVTDDGKLDVVAAATNTAEIVTFPGNGDGTLGAPFRSIMPPVTSFVAMWPDNIVAADFSGDGKPDVAVSSSSANRVGIFASVAGRPTVDLQSQYPTITAGQTTSFTIGVRSFIQDFWTTPPAPTGSVTLREGATIIGSATLQNGLVTIGSSALSIGPHTLIATYNGDANWRAWTSDPFVQTVTAEHTTVTLVTSNPAQPLHFGDSFTLTATVTSPLPGSLLGGSLWLYTDGVRSQYSLSTPSASFFPNTLPVGTHTFQAAFEGTATQPPSVSNVITVTIVRAPTTTSIFLQNSRIFYGAPLPNNQVYISSNCCASPQAAAVRIYEGPTLLATTTASGNFTVPVLPIGVHYLRAVYDGDQNFEPSQSALAKLIVSPLSPLEIDVTSAIGSNIISVTTWGSRGYPRYELYRRIDSGPWTLLFSSGSAPLHNQQSILPGTVYAYRVNGLDANGAVLTSTQADLAMVQTYTDDPLATGTMVKAVHVQEVLAATNTLRAAAGLPAVTLDNLAPGQLIRASHILALRLAINEGRTAFGATAFVFTDPLTAGSLVTAKDIQDLREAMR